MTGKVNVIPPERYISGVTPKAANKIHEMLQSGRRYFGSSGAMMSHFVSDPDYADPEKYSKAACTEALEAERETTEILRKWVADKPNAVLIDSVYIPGKSLEDGEPDGETGVPNGIDLDHIIVMGQELIFIDTKRWKKKKNYSVGDEGEALMTDKDFDGNILSLNEHIDDWLRYLQSDAWVTGIVLINQEEVTVRRNKNWYTNNFRLVEIDRFEELLADKLEQIEEENLENIDTTLIAQLVVRCVKPFDPYTKVFSMDSLRKFNGN